MGRGKSTGGVGCLILMGITIWLFYEYPAYAWIGVGLIVLLALLFAGSGTCQVCGVALKKAIYHWEIDGEKKIVCPA
jgi:hypothetical protein